MGHGRCYAVAPDLLSDDEQGFVAEAGQDLDVPAELTGQAQDAAGGRAPEYAITFTQS